MRNDREPNDVDYYWTLNNMPLYGPAKSISKRLSVLKRGGGGGGGGRMLVVDQMGTVNLFKVRTYIYRQVFSTGI